MTDPSVRSEPTLIQESVTFLEVLYACSGADGNPFLETFTLHTDDTYEVFEDVIVIHWSEGEVLSISRSHLLRYGVRPGTVDTLVSYTPSSIVTDNSDPFIPDSRTPNV